ncbi:MAG: hypothetical protein WHT06_10420 [Desulfobacterales bacterium]
MVRYATLAPSSHNTQCWRFRAAERSVAILPDFARRCPLVDPDDHHLFVSLGCAAQNLLLAAEAMGFRGEAVYDDRDGGAIRVQLEKNTPRRSPLFEAIPRRQSTRGEYDGTPLSNRELRFFEGSGCGDGVEVRLITERREMERVLEFVVEANRVQMRDPAFVRELKSWIRYDGREAVQRGDGLFSASSGNPTVPPFLGRLMFDLFLDEARETAKYSRHIRSAAGLAVFFSGGDDRARWVAAGRAFQRLALQAEVLDVRTAHLNQPLEVAPLRASFAAAFGLGKARPDLLIRFGHGPKLPPSLRRPIDRVIEAV